MNEKSELIFTIETISNMAKFYSKELWNIDSPVIIINKRFKTTIAEQNGNIIKLNPIILNQNKYIITDILLHELCHYYCEISGFDDLDDSEDFLKELKLIQSNPSEFYAIINGKMIVRQIINDKTTYSEYVPTKLVKVLTHWFESL